MALAVFLCHIYVWPNCEKFDPMNFAISRIYFIFFLCPLSFDPIMNINLNKLDATMVQPRISPMYVYKLHHAIGAILLNTFDKFASIFDNVVSLFCRICCRFYTNNMWTKKKNSHIGTSTNMNKLFHTFFEMKLSYLLEFPRCDLNRCQTKRSLAPP